MKEPSGTPPPGLAEATGLRLGLQRCPFCHDELSLEADEWVSCWQCQARHHRACWGEGGSCSACGGERFLAEASPQDVERASRAEPEAMLAPVPVPGGTWGLWGTGGLFLGAIGAAMLRDGVVAGTGALTLGALCLIMAALARRAER